MATDIGSRLGHYVLEHLIGSGGSARVYRAVDTRTKAICALKVIAVPPDREEAEMMRRWFQRELKALSVVDHPGVLRLVGYGDTPEGEPYMATEFLEGTDLKIAVEEHGPLDEPAALAVIGKVLSGLGAAHGLGIAHRDLKPANLFLCRDGRVVILDFGLARALSENVGTTLARGAGTKLIGTPQFLSPEQVNGVSLSLQSDLFSLGATFYYLLSGQYAFKGDKPLDVITSIVMNRRTHLRETAPKVSAATAAGIDQLLAPEPSDRPADARAAKLVFDAIAKTARDPEGALQRYVKKITGQTQLFRVAGAAVDENTTQEIITEAEKTQIRTLVADSTRISTTPTARTAKKDETSRNIQARKTSPLLLVGGGIVIGLAAATGLFILLQRSAEKPRPAATVVEAPPPAAPNTLPPPSQPETVDVPVPVPDAPKPSEPAKPPPVDKNATGALNCVLKQWAEVIVDGESKGKKQNAVSFVLAAGKHELEFQNTKYPPKKLAVVIKKNAETRVEVDFTK